MKKFKLLMILCMLLNVSLYAQVTTSGMNGLIKGDNEPLIGATIQAVHIPSGTTYGTITNADGRFSLQGMRTGGPYKVDISYIGFKNAVYEDISLSLGDNYVLNATLHEDSGLLDEVVVIATKSKFSGTKTGASTNINNSQLTALPSISRSLSDFTKLSPYAGTNNSFGGQDGRMNNITIDGANFNNNFGLSSTPMPGGGSPISLDAIEELQVNIAPFDVRQANFIGAGINAITKSGTNTYRGTAYTYFRNQHMRGNKIDGVDLGERPEEEKRTYGFTFGGPIIKNKLFFFVNGEYEDAPKPIFKWKLSTDGVGSDDNLITRVTAKDMEAFAQVLRDQYDYDPGSYTNYNAGTFTKKALTRIDWNINTNNKLTVRYNYTKNQYTNPTSQSMPGTATSHGHYSSASLPFRNSCYEMNNLVHSLTAELNSNFGGKMSNQVLATLTKIKDERGSDSSLFPMVDILKDGDMFMTAGYELYTYNNAVANDIWTLTDNFTLNLDKHILTAGLSYESQYVSNSFMGCGLGYYRYNSFDDFKNGAAPILYSLTYGYGGEDKPKAELSFGQFSAYVQDMWNINQNLKVTAGLRMDIPTYLNDLMENKAVSELTFANGAKINTGTWPGTKVLFSPRAGFNWDVLGDNNLRLRGGTGIFTGRMPFVFFTNMPTNSGMIQNTVTISDPSALVKLAGKVRPKDEVMALLPDLFPQTPVEKAPGAVAGIDPDFKLPQIWKSTLAADIKLPLPFNAGLTLEGVFAKNLNAVLQQNVNMISADNAKVTQFNGPDKRYMYPGANDSRVIPNMSGAYILTNTSKGYSYSFNATLNMNPIERLNLMMAYTHTSSKEVSGNPGAQPYELWQNTPTVNGGNYLPLRNSQYLTPNRLIASAAYKFSYAKHFATTVSLYYTGYAPGNYSYMYNGDMNRDGINNDLIYIPKSKDELKFIDKNGFTADEQATAFWNFVNQDPYLKKHKGEYAEAYSARYPWLNQFDFKLVQDFNLKVGKTMNTLQFTLDIFNIGNLLNDTWGISKIPVNSGRILKYEGVTSDNVPTYSMYYSAASGKNTLPTETFSYQKNSSNCWQIQVGVRYIFN